MNVSIVQTPADFQPVKTDGLFFVVSADTTSVFSFRYVYNLYIEGVKVFTGKATPNPEGLGVIDVSKVLNAYVNNSPISYSADTAVFTHQTFPFSRPYSNQVLNYYIEVGEEHSTTPTGRIEQYSGIGNAIGNPGIPSLDYRVYLGTYPVNYLANTQDFNYGPFVLSGTPVTNTTGLFMTNSPRQRDITMEDYYTLSFTNYRINNELVYSEPYYVTYKFYDGSGTQLYSYSFTNEWENGGGPLSSCTGTYPVILPPSQSSTDFNILNVGAGPLNLPYIPNNTSYYTIQLFGVASTRSITPTPTPSFTPTPTKTPTPSATPPSCKEYLVENNTGGVVVQTITDCNGNPTTYTFQPGDILNVCVTTAPLSTLTWTLLGNCLSGCLCLQVNFSADSRSRTLYYKDCNQQLVSLTMAPFGQFSTCICGLGQWTGTGITIEYQGSCGSVTPTPTPTPSATPDTSTQFATLRSCCDPGQFFDAVVPSRLSYGQVISYGGQCWQFVSVPISGITNVNGTIYSSCSSCVADIPCGTQQDINTLKPDVEPNQLIPSGANSGTCITYSACSEVFTFNIVCNESSQFGQLQLMFRNRFGSYDYYRFWRGKSEALGIERQTFQQYNQTWGQNNILKTTYSRGITNWYTEITETHIINSGFIPQSDMVYLQELYTSDDVYEIKPDGTLFPINVVNEEFIIKNKGNKSLVNLELTYVYSNNIRMLGF